MQTPLEQVDHGGADQRRQARLIMILDLVLVGCSSSFAGVLALTAGGKVFIPDLLIASALLVGNGWLLRRSGRVDLAVFGLSLIVLSTVIAASWQQGGLLNNAFIWGPMACMVAFVLSGPRFGWVCVAVEVVHLSSLYLAGRAGHVFGPLIQDRTPIFVSQLAAALFAGAFAWLYDRSRREALASRDAALASVEEGQEARLALVENVDSVIFSVDRNLRLIAGNSRFAQLGGITVEPGQPVLVRLPEAQRADLTALLSRCLAGEQFSVERTLMHRTGPFECALRFNPIRRASGEVRGVTVAAHDISEQNRRRAELERVHRELEDAAHLAGKAEVATDVLHNVGNVLAALIGGANLLLERLQASKVPFLGKTVALLPETPGELSRFLATDEKGRQIRPYLGMLAESLEQERAEMICDMETLGRQLDHVKSVVARQQSFARADSVVETVALEAVIGEALQMGASSFEHHGIEVTTDLAALPPLMLDRHKLIEVLTNFIANSRQALDAARIARKRITVRAFRNPEGRLQIDVSDNGVGMTDEHVRRLFAYGFTTKSDGHGFGLAGSLLTARSMGGTLRGHSDGPGQGATFTVELPFRTEAANSARERAA